MIKDIDFWKGKKVFITGHTGFKGAWLSYVLKLFGAKVYGYSLKPKSRYSFFELLKMNKGYFYKNTYANILELKKIKEEVRKAKPDIVFHLAAQALVRESYKNPLETYNVNYIGSLNLMHACLNQKSIKSMTTQELFEQMQGLWNEFSTEHSKASKAAHGRARKAVGDLKKLVTEYRKASVAEDKAK